MSPITYFRWSLAVPLLLPLLLLPFGLNLVAGILYLSLAFGGVQYLIFAIVLFVLVGRLGSSDRIRRLSYWAPLLFVPVQALGWVVYEAVDQWVHPERTWGLDALLPFAIYSLLIGYVYVGLVNLAFLVARRSGWVMELAG